ncbi:hypothetical protein K9D97_002130 [Enterococcus faecalis]|nr:hypothetical protein [Enterococcus faecalis]
MKQLHKNRWLLIGLILITIFSSIGSSLSVIAETLDFSTVETTDTLDEKENSTEIERTKESSIEETAKKTKETENDSDELTSVESSSSDSITEDDGNEITSEESIQENYSLSQRALDFNPPSRGDIGTRAWTPGCTTVQAQRNYLLNTEIPSEYGNEILTNSEDKLGSNVGDTIEFSLSRDWIFHSFFDWVNNTGSSESWYGRVNPTNVKATTASPFISAKAIQTSNSEWKIVVTRVKKGYTTDFEVELNYDLQFDYYSSTYFGALPGTEWTDWIGQLPVVISNIDSSVKIEATPPPSGWGDSIIFGTREANDQASKKPFITASMLTLTNSNGILTIDSNLGNAHDESGSIPSGLVIDFGQSREALNASLYSMRSSNYLTDSNRYLVHSATGRDSVLNTVTKFPSPQKVNQGDILRAYSNVTMNDRSSMARIRHMVNTDEYNDVKDGQKEIFYQITNNGYQVLHFNHLENDKNFEILTSDTQESLNDKLKNKEFLTNGSYMSVEVMKFSVYPDNSKTGNTTGTIQVREKLVNGNYVYYDYEVSFTVKDDLKIIANPNKQTLNLGSDFSKVSPYDLVTDVKLGNQTLAKDDYTVSVQNTVSTDTVGDKTTKVLITYKKDQSKTLSLDVPVNVMWGNSVVYGGYDYGGDGRTTAAFTLNTGTSPFITASQGGTRDDNEAIHSNFSNEKYYMFDWFDFSNEQMLLMNEDNNGTKYIQANGDDLKKDKLKEWGTNQKQIVNYGDIVRAWQAESSKNWLYENEQKNSYNMGKKSVYYEITKEGYKTLHLNHLETKTPSIPIYSTEEYLDEHISDYIDLKGYPNISVKEFSQYPNTKASGQQKGKIIVEETLTTGKKVQYEYEITFTIGDGTLTYSVPKTLTFKEFAKSKSEQVIQRKYSGDLGLEISDNRGEGKQGNWRLTAQVSQSEELSPYLIFRDDSLQDKYLNQGATEIYSQAKQSNPTEPLNVEVSGQWTKDTGILLKVPSNNTLSSKQYASTITWNLVEGP